MKLKACFVVVHDVGTATEVDSDCKLRERVEIAVAYSDQISIFLTRITKTTDSKFYF
jgi:hypothetical protein